MKRILNIALFFTSICLMCLPLKSQTEPGFTSNDFKGEPLEEVTLQTDRDIYIAGESVWFSAFCSISSESDPSPLSKIIYIEIYDAKRKVFVREKFKLNNGHTSGHLIIPEETPTGYYFIRSYTMYLRNYPPEKYYFSSLTIINSEIPQSGGKFQREIEMIPEGGILISGIPSKVALKIPAIMLHKTTTAYLTNTKGEHLEKLNIYPNGLCLIDFIPADSLRYFLNLKFENGDSLQASLPVVQKTGMTVRTEILGQKLHVKVYHSEIEKNSNLRYKLKIFTDSFIKKYEAEILIKKTMDETVIPLSSLPVGLNYAVVTDLNDSILNFNPVYLESIYMDSIYILPQKNTFKTREKVEFDIQLPEALSNDFKMMTISVTEKGTSQTIDANLPDIVIENPGLLTSCFEKNLNKTDNMMEQVNIAMMLYSPSALKLFDKFSEQEQSMQIYFPEIRDVSISGFLLNKITRQPMKDVQMFVSVLFEDFQLHTTKTMDDGSFVFALNHLTGKHNLYLFPDISDGGEHELFIHNDFSTQFRDLNECYPIIDSTFLKLLDELYTNQQISSNFPVESVVQYEVPELSPWFGVEMVTVNLSDYINLTSFREVINEIVPSVRLKLNNDEYRFTIFDEKAQLSYENPLVLLDNIPVTDISELVKIHPAFIEKIEVMNQPYILGNYTIWGLIIITTKTENFGGIKLPKESAFINYQTLRNSSSFLPLDFSIDTTAQSSNPFYNTVLYWNSLTKNDSIHKQISFYTSDRTTEYDVIIRGILADGRPYMGINTFIVTD